MTQGRPTNILDECADCIAVAVEWLEINMSIIINIIIDRYSQ